jgi:hypothetical protein
VVANKTLALGYKDYLNENSNIDILLFLKGILFLGDMGYNKRSNLFLNIYHLPSSMQAIKPIATLILILN